MCDEELPEAPVRLQDGRPMQEYQLAFTLTVNSYGVDEVDAAHRALAAMRMPGGPFPHANDVVRGPGQRWMCEATVVNTHLVMTKQLSDDDTGMASYEG